MELLKILYLISKEYPLRPDYYARDGVIALTPERLADLDVRGLILDLDNTLMLPSLGYLLDDIAGWLRYIRSAGVKVIILSNNKKAKYMKHIKELFASYQIEVISHGKKPYEKNINKAVEILGEKKENCLIVGDRVLTDILGGLNCDIRSVLVPALIGDDEIIIKKIGRKVEKAFLGQAKNYI